MLDQHPRETKAKARAKTPRADAANGTSGKNGATAKPAAQPLFNPEAVAEIAEQQAEWERGSVAESTKRVPERRKEFTTQSGMPIARLYTPADTPDFNYERDLGFPGEYPY